MRTQEQQAQVHRDRPAIPDGESTRLPLFRWLFAPPRFAFKLWFGLVFFLTLAILYLPFKLMLKRPGRYRRAFRLKRTVGWILLWFGWMPPRIDRRALLPKPPYIACSNHGSYIDIPQMYNVLPDYFLFMGKYELLKWPLLKIFFKGMDIAVNRGSHVEAAKAFRRAAQAIDEGACIAIFPEGTIPLSAPRMKNFKDGAIKLAIEKQVPVVPITFVNHWKVFGDPQDPLSRGRPGVTRVIVHAPVDTRGLRDGDLVGLRNRIFDTIQAPLLEAYGTDHP